MRLSTRVDKIERQKRPIEFVVLETQAEADRIQDRVDNVVVVITGVCAPIGSEVEVDAGSAPQGC